MRKRSLFHVKKRTLFAIAGCVWLIAGINVARLGIISYMRLDCISYVHILLSLAVFCAFGFMFYKMSTKHTKRIKGYREEYKPVWKFFELKSYIIMAVMMAAVYGSARRNSLPRCSSPRFIRDRAVRLLLPGFCSG